MCFIEFFYWLATCLGQNSKVGGPWNYLDEIGNDKFEINSHNCLLFAATNQRECLLFTVMHAKDSS